MSIPEIKQTLKTIYKQRLMVIEEQWPPVRGNKLINLQLVETEKSEGFNAPSQKKKTPILYTNLFSPTKGQTLYQIRKILVEGNAGSGKTTLCVMLTEGWAMGDIFTMFDFVLFLPLRDYRVSSAKTFADLLKVLYSSEEECLIVLKHIEKNCGNNILIITDGWDELPEEMRSGSSLIHQLFTGQILRLASVILTSRPSASAHLRSISTVHRVVEVVGFDEESIRQYIRSEFESSPAEASSLIEQLETNAAIQSVCTIPINCAIICNLWCTLKQVLPRTLSELYTQLVLNLILRNIKKVFTDLGFQSLTNFDQLPDLLQKKFWLICKFAYMCLLRDQIVFTEAELMSFFPEGKLNSELLCYGLLQSAKSLLPVGHALSFHFLHLTIQEFLAALHFVTLSPEKKLKFCKYNARKSHFSIFWQFAFGLGCREPPCNASDKIVSFDNELVDLFVLKVVTHDTDKDNSYLGMCLIPDDQPLLLCHCAMESNSTTVSTKVAKQIGRRFMTSSRTPMDFLAVCHVLQHSSQSAIDIDMNGCELNDEYLKELSRAVSKNVNFNRLSLEANNLTGIGIINLFEEVKPYACFDSLEFLFLKNNKLTGFAGVFNHCYLSNLTWLSLSHNPLGENGINNLADALEWSYGLLMPNLSRLELCNTFPDDATKNKTLLAKLLPSLKNVNYLDLSGNNFGVPCACILGKNFPKLAITGITLELRDTNLNGEAMVCFSEQALKHSSNRMRIAFPFLFASTSLILDSNPIEYEGLVATFRLLGPETFNIRHLSLKSTNICSNSASYTGPKLCSLPNCSISPYDNMHSHMLSLEKNTFSGENISILVECVRVYQQVESLHLKETSLSSGDIINFLARLKESKIILASLKSWYLSENPITDQGVQAIIESIPDLFPGLNFVVIDDNPEFSTEMKKKLRDALKANETEEEREYTSAVYSELEELCSVPEPNIGAILGFGIQHMGVISKRFLNFSEDDFALNSESESSSSHETKSPSLSDEFESNDETPVKLALSASSSELEKSNHHDIAQKEVATTVSSSTSLKLSTGEDEAKSPAVLTGESADKPGPLTIDQLKSKSQLNDSDLEKKIEQEDFYFIAKHFDCIEHYIYQFGLSASQQADVREKKDTQTAIMHILKCWTEEQPDKATYGELLQKLLDLEKGMVATYVCDHLKTKTEVKQQSLCCIA